MTTKQVLSIALQWFINIYIIKIYFYEKDLEKSDISII